MCSNDGFEKMKRTRKYAVLFCRVTRFGCFIFLTLQSLNSTLVLCAFCKRVAMASVTGDDDDGGGG